LHVEWVNQSVIENAHMGRSRLQRFLKKEALNQNNVIDLNDLNDDEQYFDSKYEFIRLVILMKY
jgi:hypothetical protein